MKTNTPRLKYGILKTHLNEITAKDGHIDSELLAFGLRPSPDIAKDTREHNASVILSAMYTIIRTLQNLT